MDILSENRFHYQDQRGWLVYRYKREGVVTNEEGWEQAFHGTWWPALQQGSELWPSIGNRRHRLAPRLPMENDPINMAPWYTLVFLGTTMANEFMSDCISN